MTMKLSSSAKGEEVNQPGNHVLLVAGEVTATMVQQFVAEVVEASEDEPRLVVLVPTPPSADVKALFAQARYQNQVQYLQGSVLDQIDLDRCAVRSAKACFVITDK